MSDDKPNWVYVVLVAEEIVVEDLREKPSR
jgi:hypothetical protein